MLNHDDKRLNLRMMAYGDLELILDDSEVGSRIEGVCREVSSTGMSAEVQEPVEAGVMLKVKLASNNPSVPAVSEWAKVVRCTLEFDDTYVLGIEFIELN